MGENVASRACLECGAEIKGRRDKKFCDDQCRNSFNNKLNADGSPEMRMINNILKKNRKILEDVLQGEGKAKLSSKRLSDLGFNLNYLTHTYTTQTGSIYRYCYEYGYLPLENEFYLVVKNEKK